MSNPIDRFNFEYDINERLFGGDSTVAQRITEWWLMDARLDYYLDPDSYPRSTTPNYELADMDDEARYDAIEAQQAKGDSNE